MDYTIEVTPEDIGRGIKGSHSSCPVALAAKRAFPELVRTAHTIMVANPCRIEILDARNRVVAIAHLPWAVAWYILDFDRGRPVAPVTFPIRLDPT